MPFGKKAVPALHGTRRVTARGDILNADQYPREFQALNQLSQAMTHLAFCGMQSDGRPLRHPWFRRRPTHMEPFVVEPPSSWMPVPYLAFPYHLREQLYFLVTEGGDRRLGFTCPICQHHARSTDFPNVRREMTEDGNFFAPCPKCSIHQKWYLDEGRFSDSKRLFNWAFRQGFCDALAQGLPLRSSEPMLYLGPVDEPPDSPKCLVRHQLMSCIDRQPISLDLPHDARIYVFEALSTEGTGHIPPTACFGRALGNLPPESWQKRNLANRWNSLSEVCEKQRIGLLQRIWFQQQGLRHPTAPNQILFPAALAAAACHDIQPLGVWWDFSPTAVHFDSDTATYILPPIPLKHWDHLRIQLPGNIHLNAGIGDPRFDSAFLRPFPRIEPQLNAA